MFTHNRAIKYNFKVLTIYLKCWLLKPIQYKVYIILEKKGEVLCLINIIIVSLHKILNVQT